MNTELKEAGWINKEQADN